jgi:rhodanese-related sulfurtransferase
MVLKQFIFLLLVATVVSLGVNLVSPNGVELIGQYRSLSGGDGPIVPPTAEPGDPPFVNIDEAYLEYTQNTALFVDARDEMEFLCGTIPGSVNIPFEYLPEGDLSVYFDSVLNGAPRDTTLIIFCSGEECDLSLHLARNMQSLGYTNTLIFFGGSREWESSGLEIERRPGCDAY